MSSTVGPVSFGTTLGAGSHRASTASSSRDLAAAAHGQRQSDKAQQAQHLSKALQQILDIHRAEFPPAQPMIAPVPSAVDHDLIRANHRLAALQGLGFFERRARIEAEAVADRSAQQEIGKLESDNYRRNRERQLELNEVWRRLSANDPRIVLGCLAEAFEDNQAAAAAVGVEGDDISLVVLVPPTSEIPSQKPATTAAGNLSLKKLTAGELSDIYKQVVYGYAIATVKEAFAVAPGLRAAHVVAVRSSEPDAYGQKALEPLLAARIARDALRGVRWGESSALTVMNGVSTELVVKTSGVAKKLTPLDLSGEPAIAAVMEVLDAEDLD